MSASTKTLKVYKSSAGSGKTTTLTLEYLKLTLGKPEAYKHILALTFTNKAAQEMKERILEFLGQLIQLKLQKDDPYFLETLLQEIPKYKTALDSKGILEARRMIQNDSLILHKNLIHNYSEYAVSTLDSFTNRIIRSFSHDLGLSFNYQVELNADQMLKDAVEELVSRIDNKEELITKILTCYSQQKIDNERSRNIVNDLKDRARSLLNDVEEEFLKPLRELDLEEMSSIQKQLEAQVKEFEKQLQNFGQEFIDLCKRNAILPSMFFQGAKSIYPYFKRFTEKDYKSLEPNSYVIKMIEEDKWTAGKVSPADKTNIESQGEEIKAIYRKTQAFIEDYRSDYILKKEVFAGIYPFMVLMELEKIINQMKVDQQMIHISDFNKIISEKIANESAPYIFERIGNKYQHFLLDEFQDTSVIQWHNLLPLVENSLSENHFNLIVGDAKQSIYRWRGSDVEQFSHFPKLTNIGSDPFMADREQQLYRAYEEIHLTTNYRTGENIVQFNNKLFQFIIDREFLPKSQASVYADLIQNPQSKKDLPSSVEIHQMDIKEIAGTENKNLLYIERTYEIIQQCLEQGFQLKDIVVLARKNDFLIQVAHYLLSKGVNVISSESLHVDTSPQVQFLVSVIQYLYQPKESLYQSEILKYLFRQGYINSTYSDCLMNLDSSKELQDLWIALEINLDKEELLKLEAYEALEQICDIFRMDKNNALLHFFLEAAFIFTQDNHQSLADFNEWWTINAYDYKLEVPEEWDAVKLMSFHKSKGLEFPVVINHFAQAHLRSRPGQEIWLNPEFKDFPQLKSFPFKLSSLEGTQFESFKTIEDDLGKLDELNIFYVAMTRPEQKLYLLVDKYEVPKKSKSTSNLFKFDQILDEFILQSEAKQLEENVFVFGDDTVKKQEKKHAESMDSTSVSMTSQTNADWRNSISLALDTEEENTALSSAQWGQKVHAVLSEIQSEEDIDFILSRMVYKSWIAAEERDEIEAIVKRVIEHPLLQEFYHKGLANYSERELYSSEGKKYRPDKMIELEEQFIIIDYKTGKKQKKDENQVLNYCQLVEKYSGKPSKGLLVYIHDEVEVKVVNN
ncbi:UvrD-helicase domain-containing protein [Lentimicrobium sp. L6]|uniref:UvrD-helicase domain-containing protein n=1 Tax=Lentimicrobium sp. L6 TaxID=2735916 RepID=UPI00155418FF|nr:UvrD-helicase domain-containing protein [Lentimicrobium sp. L6]NPD86820.1 UvrD-helicase domain-containing protein [Lentimicrobium sp. L6]